MLFKSENPVTAKITKDDDKIVIIDEIQKLPILRATDFKVGYVPHLRS